MKPACSSFSRDIGIFILSETGFLIKQVVYFCVQKRFLLQTTCIYDPNRNLEGNYMFFPAVSNLFQVSFLVMSNLCCFINFVNLQKKNAL